jgi:hypothetical protein
VAFNLISQGPVSRKAIIKSKRLNAAISDRYSAQLIGVKTSLHVIALSRHRYLSRLNSQDSF